MALSDFAAEHLDGLYPQLERHGKQAGTPTWRYGSRWSDVDHDRGRVTVAHTITEVRGQNAVIGS